LFLRGQWWTVWVWIILTVYAGDEFLNLVYVLSYG
jgi:hypothetical protein